MQGADSQTEQAWAALVGSASLEVFCDAWLRILTARMARPSAAMLVLRGDDQVFRPAASWPSGVDPEIFEDVASRTLGSREPVDVEAGAEAGGRMLGFPLEYRDEMFGAVVVAWPTRPAVARRDLLREIHWASAWLYVTAGAATRYGDTGAGAAIRILRVLGRVQQHARLLDASLALSNLLAAELKAVRVGIGVERTSGVVLTALSGMPTFDRRTREAGAIEGAMEESCEQRRTVTVPALPGADAGMTAALRASLKPDRAGAATPLLASNGLPMGAIWVERAANLPWSVDEVLELDRLGRVVGPILEAKVRDARLFGGRPAQLWEDFRVRISDRRRPALPLALGAIAMSLAAILIVPVDRRVTADAVLEGARELVVAAPFDGYIGAAFAQAGEIVEEGQPLAELDTRELRLELERQSLARSQHDRRFVEAVARREMARAGVAAAARDEIDAELELIGKRISRATMSAPIDAFVITGDLRNQIGAPVRRGQELFRLSPLGEFRVNVKVDERDVREIEVGQRGVLVLAGRSDAEFQVEIRRIGNAEAAEGINFFNVEAALLDSDAGLRPGLEGVVKVVTGQTNLFDAWSRRTRQWLRLTWFKLTP